MAEQLKIEISAETSKAEKGLASFGKLVVGQFNNITNAATSLSSSIDKSIQKINSSLASLKVTSIDLSVDTSALDSSVKDIQSKFAALTDPEINVLANTEQAEVKVKELLADLSTLKGSELFIRANDTQALKAINEVEAELNSLVGKQIKLNINSADATAKLNLLEKELADLQSLVINPKISTAQLSLFEANIKRIKNEIAELKSQKINVGVKVTSTGLTNFQAALGKATASISQLQAKGAGLNNFFNQVSVASNKAAASLNKFPQSTNAATQSMINLGRVVQDAPFGFLGIANNLNPLLEGFQRLKVETGSTKTALKSLGSSLMGAGGIGLAVSVVSSLLVVFGDRLFKTSKSAEEAENKIKTLNETLKSIQGEAAKEAANTAGLVAVLKSETETRERKVAALKELKQIQPEIFGQLKLESNTVAGLDAAYQAYIQTLRLVITAKLKQAQIEAVTQKILEKEGLTLTKSQKDGIKALKEILKPLNDKKDLAFKTGEAGAAGSKLFQQEQKKEADSVTELNNLYKDQAQLFKDLQELSKGIKIKIPDPGSDLDKTLDSILSRARQFVKEFGDTFVLPDLEETFFRGKDKLLPIAKKLLEDITKGDLKIKIPVVTEFEFLPESTGLTKEQLDKLTENFFKDIESQRNIPVSVTIDPTLSVNNIKLIEQKLKLREQFQKVFGDLGLNVFNKIDFSNITKGIDEATKKLGQMVEVAQTLTQSVGQGLSNAFDNVFDAILQGKDVFKALGESVQALVVDVIKAIAKMLILRFVTSLLSGGTASVAQGLGSGLIGAITGGGLSGAANLGSGGELAGRSFQNTLNVVVQGQISGQTILLAGQRAAGSNGR